MQDVLWLLCSSEAMKVQALTTVCAGEWSSMLNILSLVSIILVIELFGNYIIFLTWWLFFSLKFTKWGSQHMAFYNKAYLESSYSYKEN